MGPISNPSPQQDEPPPCLTTPPHGPPVCPMAPPGTASGGEGVPFPSAAPPGGLMPSSPPRGSRDKSHTNHFYFKTRNEINWGGKGGEGGGERALLKSTKLCCHGNGRRSPVADALLGLGGRLYQPRCFLIYQSPCIQPPLTPPPPFDIFSVTLQLSAPTALCQRPSGGGGGVWSPEVNGEKAAPHPNSPGSPPDRDGTAQPCCSM